VQSCKPGLQILDFWDAAAELTLQRSVGVRTSEAGEGEAMRAQHFRGNVFVANLPPEFSDEQLAEAFDPFGIVLSATVARDPATGKKLRYGFVDIATERAAKLAIDGMNGKEIGGFNLEVRISERSAKKTPQPPAASRSSPARVRVTARARDDEERLEAPDNFRPRPQPRRQPSFQVERRSLPRRPIT
jgi:RNA recognition motif-containing protein